MPNLFVFWTECIVSVTDDGALNVLKRAMGVGWGGNRALNAWLSLLLLLLCKLKNQTYFEP